MELPDDSDDLSRAKMQRAVNRQLETLNSVESEEMRKLLKK